MIPEAGETESQLLELPEICAVKATLELPLEFVTRRVCGAAAKPPGGV